MWPRRAPNISPSPLSTFLIAARHIPLARHLEEVGLVWLFSLLGGRTWACLLQVPSPALHWLAWLSARSG